MDGKHPSEQELAREYSVSRVCMGQAMAELEKDVLIVRCRRHFDTTYPYIIEALRPSGTEVELLKITYDTLILQVTSTSYLEDDTPYEHSVTSWIGDSIRLKMDVFDIEHGLEFSGKV